MANVVLVELLYIVFHIIVSLLLNKPYTLHLHLSSIQAEYPKPCQGATSPKEGKAKHS